MIQFRHEPYDEFYDLLTIDVRLFRVTSNEKERVRVRALIVRRPPPPKHVCRGAPPPRAETALSTVVKLLFHPPSPESSHLTGLVSKCHSGQPASF